MQGKMENPSAKSDHIAEIRMDSRLHWPDDDGEKNQPKRNYLRGDLAIDVFYKNFD